MIIWGTVYLIDSNYKYSCAKILGNKVYRPLNYGKIYPRQDNTDYTLRMLRANTAGKKSIKTIYTKARFAVARSLIVHATAI